MAEKRINKRVAFRVVVRYGPTNPPERISFVTDISSTGVYIKTNNVFKPGTKLYLIFEIDSDEYEAEGIVHWAKTAPAGLVRYVKNGMGIRFTKANEQLLNLYNKKIAP